MPYLSDVFVGIYKGISPLNSSYKIYAALLAERLQQKLEIRGTTK